MQILIEEKQIESAIEQTRLSGDRAAAARLLDKKLDEAMPQVILSVGRICEKLEANEK